MQWSRILAARLTLSSLKNELKCYCCAYVNFKASNMDIPIIKTFALVLPVFSLIVR